MSKTILKYAGPLLLALVLHLALFLFVDRNWSQDSEPSSIVEFKAINAQLVMLEPKLPAKPKKAVKKTVPTQVQRIDSVDTEPKGTSESIEKTESFEEKDIGKEAELARQELLNKLARSNFEATINAEASELENSTGQQIATSFQAKIYDQVRRKWRRPPSARNGMQTKLLVELIPTGEVVSVTVVESSGLAEFDRSAEQAVIRSGSFEVPDESRLFEEYFRKFFFLFRPEDLLR
mgnify:CR=1 FL=1